MALALYDVATIRALEETACRVEGIASFELMRRAGTAAFETLRRHWPRARRIAVVCGGGNNGGDGYVLAQLAHAAGLDVTVMQVGSPAARGDAVLAWQALRATPVVVVETRDALARAQVVVDALFGIGLNRAVAGPACQAIADINAAPGPCFSLDVPSGLDADTGAARGPAVRAKVTLTFIARKLGLETGDAREHVGRLELASLAIPAAAFTQVAPCASLCGWADWRRALAPRARTAHKGSSGHVLVVGGAPGMSGAARLAAEAALRCGAGLVSVACAPAVAAGLNAGRPEIMAHGITGPDELAPLLARAGVIALGPGLGQSAWALGLWAALRDTRHPLVLDADALNLLAQDPARRADWVLTPHPGEAARLLATDTHAIAADRAAAARALQARYGGTVLLKGAGTIVQAVGSTRVIAGGNPGMGSGGMGDVLTGVVAALHAQGMPLPDAAAAGAALHAAAGDLAAADGERGLLASDLMPALRRLVN